MYEPTDRVRARARILAFWAILAAIGGSMIIHTDLALMRPLQAALAQVAQLGQ